MRTMVPAVFTAILTVVAAGGAHADNRAARVIGNSNYERLTTLANPQIDSHRMADASRETGLELGGEFQDCEVCPQMVVLPAGTITVGLPTDELGDQMTEGPQHEVNIAASFAVGKFEVTFGEWDACFTDGGCSYTPDDHGWGRGRQPVIRISWDDAQAYVQWLSGKTGDTYRLLTEAEWEYAARAGTATKFWWGAEPSHDYANYGKDFCCWGAVSGADVWKNTAPVGSFPANAFGLHDMHGNVSEWVEDCWYFYSSEPSDGAARTSGTDCRERIFRGGSHRSPPRGMRSSSRDADPVGVRFLRRGFRVARTLFQ